MQHMKLRSKAWRLFRCHIILPKTIQYLKSEECPQCSPGSYWVLQSNQHIWKTCELNGVSSTAAVMALCLWQKLKYAQIFCPGLKYRSLLPVGLSVFIIVFIYEACVLLAFMCCTILLERCWDLSEPKVKRIRTSKYWLLRQGKFLK